MDDRQFEISVKGVTKEEFQQASRQMIYDVVPTGIFMVTLITFCIALLMETVTLGAILAPYLILLLALCAGILYLNAQWKKFPQDVEYSYLIDAQGWQLSVGEEFGGADWTLTAKMKEHKHVILLYQRNSNASSSLPKRCLTHEQLTAIRGWYKGSRKDFKANDKALFQQERQEVKAKRAGRRRLW